MMDLASWTGLVERRAVASLDERLDSPERSWAMRRLIAVVVLAGSAAGCSVDAGELIAEPQNRVSLDELTQAVLDPESDVDVSDIDGLELEDILPTADSFCEAFGAAELTWLDGAIVPLQILNDAWTEVTDSPASVAADVEALRAFMRDRIDWNFGRIDRADRPDADRPMIERLERIADAAVADCDGLPLRVGYPNDWAVDRGWDDDEAEMRCADSLTDLEEGIALYAELRGGEPRHTAQIELASLVEFHRAFEAAVPSPGLWFASELHGIDASATAPDIVSMPPGEET